MILPGGKDMNKKWEKMFERLWKANLEALVRSIKREPTKEELKGLRSLCHYEVGYAMALEMVKK